MSMAIATTPVSAPLLDSLASYLKKRAQTLNEPIGEDGRGNGADAQAQARQAQEQAANTYQSRPNPAEKKYAAGEQARRSSEVIDVEATLVEREDGSAQLAAEARAAELAAQAPMAYASAGGSLQFVYAGSTPGQFLDLYA